jgi:5-deoxy-glucuronate isomerase
MPRLIRAHDNRNLPLVAPGDGAATRRCYFNLLRLHPGEAHALRVPGCELLCVVLAGRVDIAVGAHRFPAVGGRADIWAGAADSVYCGTEAEVTVRASSAGAEVAVAGGLCAGAFAPFRIAPGEVETVEVGSADTHSRRRIRHVLGQNGAGRSGSLLVSELYGDAGSWSGYPPHKHDTDRLPDETDHEEIYHYRYRPESGFGAQFRYTDEGGGAAPEAVMTRHGDTYCIDRGYHPTVRAPGHEGYIFTILVGARHRGLVQYFDPTHAHLCATIPGIQAMRDKFK